MLRIAICAIASLVLAVCLAGGVAQGQNQTASGATAPQQGTIAGRVIDAISGSPIPGATVRATALAVGGAGSASARRPPALADTDGRFVISGLNPGQFEISANARGYLSQGIGASRPGGLSQPVDLASGGRVEGLVVRMWKQGSIGGRVTDGHGEPLAGVTVGLLKKETVGGRVRYRPAGGSFTDDRGQYVATGILPGDYVVVVPTYNQTFAASTMDMLAAGRTASRAEQAALERLFRGSGSLLQFGPGYRSGDFFLVPVGPVGEISALLPTVQRDGTIISARTTFHPASPSLETANIVTARVAEGVTGIDIRVGVESTTSVSGTVYRPDGTPAPHLAVRLAREDMGFAGTIATLEAGVTMTDGNGRFVLLGVPSGSYLLRAKFIPVPEPPATEGGPVLSALSSVTVAGEQVRDLSIRLAEAPRVSGRVVFSGVNPPTSAQLSAAAVEIQTADIQYVGNPPPPKGRIEADGIFKTTGVLPGAYVVRLTGVAGWTIVSATSKGRDISDQPFSPTEELSDVVVTVTDRPMNELSGVVRRQDGSPGANLVVVLFPFDRANPGLRRRQTARTNISGGYSVAGVPAGDYLVAAIEDSLSADWENPVILNQIARSASRVAVTGTGRLTTDLRLSEIRREP